MKKFEESLYGTKWQYVLGRDGRAVGFAEFDKEKSHSLIFTWNNGGIGKWQVIDERTVHTYFSDSPLLHVLTFSPDFKSFRAVRSDGDITIGTLIGESAGSAQKIK